MKRQYIYILYAVDARHLSEDDIKKNFEIFKASSPHPKKVTMEYYKRFIEDLYHESANIAVEREEIAFFLDEAEALHYAQKNIGDYNDGGCYHYGMVERVPTGCAYPSTCIETKYWLFKFVDMETGYVPISLDADELTMAIWHKYDLFYNDRDDEEEYQLCLGAIESLKDFMGGDDDDVPIHESVIPTFKQILDYVKTNNYIYPELFPYAGGDGAQFEWHMPNLYFEISVDSNGIGVLGVHDHISGKPPINPLVKSGITLEMALQYIETYVLKK